MDFWEREFPCSREGKSVANSAVLPLNALADVTLPRSHLLGPFVFELLSFKPRPSECHRPWEAT